MQLFHIFKKKTIPHSADRMAGTSFSHVVEEELRSEAFKVSLLNNYQRITALLTMSAAKGDVSITCAGKVLAET